MNQGVERRTTKGQPQVGRIPPPRADRQADQATGRGPDSDALQVAREEVVEEDEQRIRTVRTRTIGNVSLAVVAVRREERKIRGRPVGWEQVARNHGLPLHSTPRQVVVDVLNVLH